MRASGGGVGGFSIDCVGCCCGWVRMVLWWLIMVGLMRVDLRRIVVLECVDGVVWEMIFLEPKWRKFRVSFRVNGRVPALSLWDINILNKNKIDSEVLARKVHGQWSNEWTKFPPLAHCSVGGSISCCT